MEGWIEVAVVLITVGGLLWLWGRRGSNLLLPPGPRPIPILGNAHSLSKSLHRDFHKLLPKYGPLMHLKIGAIPVVVAQNAALAREMTKTHDQVFAYRPQDMAIVEHLLFQGDDLGFAPPGPHWRHLRKLLASELFMPRRLNTFKDQRREEISAIMRSMLEKSKQGVAVNILDMMNCMMYNVVTRMVAGKTFYGSRAVSEGEVEEFRIIMKGFFETLNGFYIGDWFPYMKRIGDYLQDTEKRMLTVATRFDKFVQAIIDDRRSRSSKKEEGEADKQVKDFIDLLLEAKGEDGGEFGDRNIKILVQETLIAGTETTSASLQWSLAELIRRPELMKRVQEEIDTVVGRDRLVEESDLPQLKLLDAIVKETFRLHPAAPFLVVRQPVRDCRIGGYDVPSTARVFISLWAIGRDPDTWDRPLEYIPERFFDNPRDFIGSNSEFTPFGAGRRICPGLNLGVLMLHLQLAYLVQLCDFSLPNGMKPEDIDMREKPGFNLPKNDPLEVIATPRLASEFYKAHLDYQC